MKPKLLIFASGTADDGGSGFENLVISKDKGILDAEIVAVVSNHAAGGVKAKAEKHGIPFIHFDKPYTEERYHKILRGTEAEWIALSGWLKLVQGLPPQNTFNIHPGPLPRFGGKGMYGHFVHEKVIEAYKKDKIIHSAVSMHFVTPIYDEGPVFFEYPVKILDTDTAETLGQRVNEAEHEWQPIITNKVIHKKISWDGKDPASLCIYP